jgi:hypothetical protein
MINRQELNALTQIINKAPMSTAEALWVQQLIGRFEEQVVLQEVAQAQAEKESEPVGDR